MPMSKKRTSGRIAWASSDDDAQPVVLVEEAGQPLARDDQSISGSRPRPATVEDYDSDNAVAFVRRRNARSSRPEIGRTDATASEETPQATSAMSNADSGYGGSVAAVDSGAKPDDDDWWSSFSSAKKKKKAKKGSVMPAVPDGAEASELASDKDHSWGLGSKKIADETAQSTALSTVSEPAPKPVQETTIIRKAPSTTAAADSSLDRLRARRRPSLRPDGPRSRSRSRPLSSRSSSPPSPPSPPYSYSGPQTYSGYPPAPRPQSYYQPPIGTQPNPFAPYPGHYGYPPIYPPPPRYRSADYSPSVTSPTRPTSYSSPYYPYAPSYYPPPPLPMTSGVPPPVLRPVPFVPAPGVPYVTRPPGGSSSFRRSISPPQAVHYRRRPTSYAHSAPPVHRSSAPSRLEKSVTIATINRDDTINTRTGSRSPPPIPIPPRVVYESTSASSSSDSGSGDDVIEVVEEDSDDLFSKELEPSDSMSLAPQPRPASRARSKSSARSGRHSSSMDAPKTNNERVRHSGQPHERIIIEERVVERKRDPAPGPVEQRERFVERERAKEPSRSDRHSRLSTHHDYAPGYPEPREYYDAASIGPGALVPYQWPQSSDIELDDAHPARNDKQYRRALRKLQEAEAEFIIHRSRYPAWTPAWDSRPSSQRPPAAIEKEIEQLEEERAALKAQRQMDQARIEAELAAQEARVEHDQKQAAIKEYEERKLLMEREKELSRVKALEDAKKREEEIKGDYQKTIDKLMDQISSRRTSRRRQAAVAVEDTDSEGDMDDVDAAAAKYDMPMLRPPQVAEKTSLAAQRSLASKVAAIRYS